MDSPTTPPLALPEAFSCSSISSCSTTSLSDAADDDHSEKIWGTDLEDLYASDRNDDENYYNYNYYDEEQCYNYNDDDENYGGDDVNNDDGSEKDVNSYDEDVDSEDEDTDEDDGGWGMSFKKTYVVHPLAYIEKTHLEAGNKIILPLSALEELMDREVAFPMLFKIKNPSNGKISHCGVLEFSGEEEGVAIMPEWMLKNMSLEEGGQIHLENVTLNSATYVKLQPHSVEFLEIRTPKEFLEGAFSLGYSCLTVGDTIVIMHEGKKLYVDILDAKPSNAVNMIETDVEVDFAAPLDYKEPEKEPVVKEEKPVSKEEVAPIFVPFTGRARRLNETEDKSEEPISAINDVHNNNNVVTSFNYESRIVEKKDLIPNMEQKSFKPFTGIKYSLMDS